MISIIVPVYNGEKYLDDCIKSILLQTYEDWELFLIDNASEDNSLKLCREYAKMDDRIQVLHQYHNQGVSIARNLGIERGGGDYFTFIDIDDWIEAEYLQRLLDVAEETKAGLTICEYRITSDKEREILKAHFRQAMEAYETGTEEPPFLQTGKDQIRKYEPQEYLADYFLEGNTHCWGSLIHRDLLSGQHFPKGITIGEDMLFMLELSGKAKTIAVTDFKGYNYYSNEEGAMNRKFEPTYMDQICCWEKAAEKIAGKYPELTGKVESIILISVLLVVGKLSLLDPEERKAYIEEEKNCYETFMKYAGKKDVRRYLSAGYRLKLFIYKFFPKVYMFLYGTLRGKLERKP